MPEEPPPPPNFLVGLYTALLSILILIENEVSNVLFPPPLFIVSSLNTLAMLVTVLALLDANRTLINKLFPNFRGLRNIGRDVWAYLEMNLVNFWYFTGETPESLAVLVDKIYIDVTKPRHLPRTPLTDRRRRCILDVRNRVLLAFIWLRQYPKLHVLAYMFGISKSSVAEEIYHIIPILFINYRHYISWHNLNQWRSFLDTFSAFPNAVGMIDGTIHRVRRPSGLLQADFYRGDKRCHFMTTQIVIDADGLIVLLVSG